MSHLGEETVEDILGQDVPNEGEDLKRLALFLQSFQKQMQQTTATDDEVARRQTFVTYHKRKRPNTLRRQRGDIACFVRYLDESGVPITEICEQLETSMYTNPELWKYVTHGLILGFRRWQLLEGYTIESINAHLSTTKFYAGLACSARLLPAEELISINQVQRIRRDEAEQVDEQRVVTRRGTKKAEPTYLDVDQLQRIFNNQPQSEQGWRDLLALRLLYDMALRPSEAITRTVGDLDLAQETMTIYRQRKSQQLPLSKGTMIVLANYLPLLEKKFKTELGELYPERDLYPRLALLVRTRRDGNFDEASKLVIPDTGPIIAWTTQAMYERVRLLGEQE